MLAMKSPRKFYRYDKLRVVLTKNIKTEAEHYSVVFGNKPKVNKIIFGNDLGSFHHTLLFNDYLKQVDFHKTIDNAGKKEYQPVFKIPYRDAKRLLVRFRANISASFAKHLTVYSEEEFNKFDIALLPMENEKLCRSIVDIRRKNKFRVVKSIHPRTIESCFRYPDELKDEDGQSFIAFDPGFLDADPIGLVFKNHAKKSITVLDAEVMKGLSQEIDTIKNILFTQSPR